MPVRGLTVQASFSGPGLNARQSLSRLSPPTPAPQPSFPPSTPGHDLATTQSSPGAVPWLGEVTAAGYFGSQMTGAAPS